HPARIVAEARDFHARVAMHAQIGFTRDQFGELHRLRPPCAARGTAGAGRRAAAGARVSRVDSAAEASALAPDSVRAGATRSVTLAAPISAPGAGCCPTT